MDAGLQQYMAEQSQLLTGILNALNQQNKFDVTNQNITRRQQVLVPALQQVKIFVSFRSITILAISGVATTNVFTRFNSSGQPDCEIFAGKQVQSPAANIFLTEVTFVNNNATDVTVDFECGFFETIDNRLNLTNGLTIAPDQSVITGSGNSISTARVTVGLSQVTISPASATKKRTTIKALSTNTDLVGIGVNGLGFATSHVLEPGDAITLDTTALINAISLTAGQIVTRISESI